LKANNSLSKKLTRLKIENLVDEPTYFSVSKSILDKSFGFSENKIQSLKKMTFGQNMQFLLKIQFFVYKKKAFIYGLRISILGIR